MHDIIKASVFAAIGVLVFASLLVPVVSDAIDDNHTDLLNNTGVKYRMVEATESVTASWDGTTCLINGVAVTYGATYSFITADTFCCRWSSSGVPARVFDYENNTASNYPTWTLTASNGTATLTDLADSTKTETVSYSWLFIPNTETPVKDNWVMTNGNSTYYLTDDSEIYISSTDGNIVISGKFSDLNITTNGVEATYTADYTEVSGYTENVYKLDNFVITSAISGVDYTFDRFIVPYSIEVENEGTTAINNMLGLIPLVVILSLILGLIGAALYSRVE